MPKPKSTIKLYTTPALPVHYVAEDEAGDRWLIPVNPIGPDCWERRTPYLGNHTLRRVPAYVETYYQPREAVPADGG